METLKESMNLKILKRSRTPRRIIFTKRINEAREEMRRVSPDECLLMQGKEIIVQCYQQIKEFDEKIEIEMVGAEEYEEEAVKKELESTTHYLEMYSNVLREINKIIEAKTEEKGAMSEAGGEGSRRALLRLPKMELPCFDGDLEGWISWWSRFKRIHEDRELDDDEKMHYLVQAMVPGSRAHRLLGAYTHTGKNYESAIGALKGRFGDRKLLIELYLRKLIDLVVLNARRQSANLDRLYDEISANLQSLESLSIPSEYLEVFLFPLVESCLPTQILQVWQRTPEAGYGRDDEQDVEQGKGDRLRALMGFLRAEIKTQQRMNFSRLGVGKNNPKVPTLTAGTWMRDLDKKGVTIIRRKNVETSEIDLLLGADNLGKIWTDQVVCLEDGLTAIKTKIGWSIFGEIPLRESLASEYASPVFLTMSHKIKDLWDLEMLGVRDPVENISQRKKNRDIKSHFIEKIIKRDDGHYSVSLPWREGCEDIPSNFHVTQKRLEREFWPSEEPIIDETEVLKEQWKTTLVEIVIKPITHGMFKKFSEFQSNLRVVIYINDICCGAPTLEEGADITYKILHRLNQHKMAVNLNKCQICASEVELLERIINSNSKQMKEEVIVKARLMRRPYDLKSLQCILGFTGALETAITSFTDNEKNEIRNLVATTICRVVNGIGKKREAESNGQKFQVDRPRPVRTPATVSKVKRLATTENPPSQRQLSRMCGTSLKTINNIIHKDLELDTRRKGKVHKLTPFHMKNRATNARKLYEEHLAGSRSEYTATLDEAWMYVTYCNGIRKICYIKRGNQVPDNWVHQCSETFPKGFMVVGVMTGRGVLPLIKVPSKVKVNSEFYIECVLKPVIEQLKDLYPGEMDKVFLHHDKASSHTSNKTQQFLQEMKDTLGLNFIRNSDIPVKSPDASPLDFYGFGMLKQRLFNRRPKTEAGLWKAAQEEWSNVSLSKVKEVFAAWKVRCREIAKKKGKHIEHMKKIHVRKIKF
ncbi:hypothetical protein LAZ67_4001942 [Cordylochernes scorpioides]|uniref:Transposase n=1 Tax=Cordylochernes scorpioides TaxID=51811 RepID=A0ABY6KCD8_9ARAC|nr:hypothetical protein LAZ67_4001942 [Cordylochernes scorpioides]